MRRDRYGCVAFGPGEGVDILSTAGYNLGMAKALDKKPSGPGVFVMVGTYVDRKTRKDTTFRVIRGITLVALKDEFSKVVARLQKRARKA